MKRRQIQGETTEEPSGEASTELTEPADRTCSEPAVEPDPIHMVGIWEAQTMQGLPRFHIPKPPLMALSLLMR